MAEPKKDKIVALRTKIMRFNPLKHDESHIEETINAWMLEMCIKRASPMLHSKNVNLDGWIQYDFYYTVFIEV
jgi:hypothetical protein